MSFAKLIVVAGPNKGAAYFLNEGENTLGRGEDNAIVLSSGKVSKKHCTLMVGKQKVELVDNGSSNGTFVNGVLVKKKILQNREKISVGPFVLEFLQATKQLAKVHSDLQGIGAIGATDAIGASIDNNLSMDNSLKSANDNSQGILAKYKRKFDDLALPVFYDFHTRHDWATILVSMFVIFVVMNLGFTVYPVLEKSREEVLREAEARAIYIANQIANLNRNYIAENKEAYLSVEFAEADLNVKEAVIINLESRIMAPGTRLNESYNHPYVLKYRELIKKDQRFWKTIKHREENDTVVVVSPIMVLSKAKGINVPGAIAVVVFSTAGVALDSGTIGVIYFEAFCYSLLIGVVFLYLAFQVTMHPLRVLNDNMDSVLKGNAESVEKKFQNEALDQLIDTINSALSRIPKNDETATTVAATDNEQLIADNLIKSIQMMAEKLPFPAMILDGELRVKFLNSAFEEVSGIHAMNAVGDVIDNVSRDEAFPGLIKDLVSKAINTPNEGVSEEYEFSSGNHKITATAISGLPGKVEVHLFVAEKVEG